MKSNSKQQKEIIKAIDDNTKQSHWQDWQWEMQHCVRYIDTFEEQIAVKLDDQIRDNFTRMVQKFPRSETQQHRLIQPNNYTTTDRYI